MGKASVTLAAHLAIAEVPVSVVVDFDSGTDKLLRIDLTDANTALTPQIVDDVEAFSNWVNTNLDDAACRYGIGGYLENRTIYAGRQLFSDAGEARSLHLGVDIWAAAGTVVRAALDGTVHSFKDNAGQGDYGPTIILQHNVNGLTLYSLYGHLNRASLQHLQVGKQVHAGQKIAEFGAADENGNWPPHLHFQLMLDMQGNQGDFPGVCKPSQKAEYLEIIADPNLLLNFLPEDYK
ncbi:peptidoglycan DD-metalloendopeptidase family protein [Mucilaginibacter sp. UR6-1]|uniref:peptidoglycan DD-metalloendopeptidase family protein n=1 Tax=Mucilaginibacter sp. UR6-1 TaxID=1435643 RepID=UPI001E3B68BD|nr:peptidoglycan DD-metalloendopeptidase family protein [Mucilaginibacter sp. UR6-1]MCC8409541.1 peptidoglycan DD-metalloendopeptidase family protein [Mucilaginibacter sp. UR6-1]